MPRFDGGVEAGRGATTRESQQNTRKGIKKRKDL